MRGRLFLALALAPAIASAQGIRDGTVRLGPQFVSYSLDNGTSTVKVTEMAIPFAFVVPLSSRLSFDVATAYANARVEAGDGSESTINGLTDTQVRFNLILGTDAVVLTAGLNVPTGQYKVADEHLAAAGQIGNDFLAFPVSSFGNGLGGTGGIAVARSLGDWNLGLGASYRKSTEFDAYETGEVRFEPADELRLRIGVDREVAGGQMLLGAVYSQFGDDACAGCESGVSRSTYSNGARIIGQAAFDVPVGAAQMFLGGWYLHHAEGNNAIGVAPAENIMNGQIALGFNVGALFLEPSVEARLWQVDGERAGTIGYGGLRTKFDVGRLQISPSVAYGIGTLEGDPKTDITGFKGGVTIRFGGQ